MCDKIDVMEKYEQDEQARRMNPWENKHSDVWGAAVDKLQQESAEFHHELRISRSAESKYR